MIKYLGSKRRLVPILGDLFAASGVRSPGPFHGHDRVAQEFKRRQALVTAVDCARYSEVFANCWINVGESIDKDELRDAMAHCRHCLVRTATSPIPSRSVAVLPTEERRASRCVRDALERTYADSPLYPILLTSLILGADRVDSTTGVHMAYLKDWAPRAYNDLELRDPEFFPGRFRRSGQRQADHQRTGVLRLRLPRSAVQPASVLHQLPRLRDAGCVGSLEHYGIACKRIDSRDASTKSVFNREAQHGLGPASTIAAVDAESRALVQQRGVDIADRAEEMCAGDRDFVELAFDSKRYVGAEIGIFNPRGEKVGLVSIFETWSTSFVAGPESL